MSEAGEKDTRSTPSISTLQTTLGLEQKMETRAGKSVCTLDVALRLVAEYQRLFPGLRFSLSFSEYVKHEDESGIFQRVMDKARNAIYEKLGIPPNTKYKDVPSSLRKEFDNQWHNLVSQQNITSLIARGGITSADQLLPIIENAKDPIYQMFLRETFEDARIDIGALLKRMGQKMDIRDMFAELHPSETDSMRQSFRDMIDELLKSIGLEKAGAAFIVQGIK